MAHNFEKLLSSARQKYTLSHLEEQEAAPQEQEPAQQRQGEPEGASQEGAQPETRKWVFV